MDKLVLIGLTLILTACGGGGGGSTDSGERWTWEDDTDGSVSINPPDQDLHGNRSAFTRTSSGAFETELEYATFNGGVSVTSDSSCGGHTGFEVTVTNAATGATTNATERVNCDLIFKVGQWQAASVRLEPGNNRITASSGGDTDAITVVRVAIPPRVTSVTPENGSRDVPFPLAQLTVNFSENLRPSSVNSSSFFLQGLTGALVPATIGYFYADHLSFRPSRARLVPVEPLAFATTYTATITTAVTDGHGNPLANEYTWSFTTVADVIPPHKIDASPEAGSQCVAPDRDIEVQFDKLLDPMTLTTDTFTLSDSSGARVDGQVRGYSFGSSFYAEFDPADALDPAATYTANLNVGIADLAGNLVEPASWSFTTPYQAEGSWAPFSLPADLEIISEQSVVWTGTEVIAFGGFTGDASSLIYRRYDPALDQWSYLSPAGAPSARWGHTATWTGTEMIVWGGRSTGLEFHNDGARYDPVTNSWMPMSTIDAPTARNGHSAVWTGTELIVWGGGRDQNDRTFTGGRYDPATDTWTPLSTVNVPAARYKHHAVFDGQRMIVWGGVIVEGLRDTSVSDGALYDPAADVWTPLPTQNAPDVTKPMTLPDSVVLAGNDLLVWSPWDASLPNPYSSRNFTPAVSSEARRYDTLREQWFTVKDACDASATPNAVWLDGRMLSWNDDFTKGYAYDEQRDIWHPITTYPGPVMYDANFVAIGDAVIVWDGFSQSKIGYRLTF